MKGGKKSFGAKPPKSNAFCGPSNYVMKKAGYADGGAVGGNASSANSGTSSGSAPAASAAAATPAVSAANGVAPARKARARGGSCAPMQGMTSHKRLDRPGRKRGGAVGADSSPLTSAHNLTGSIKGSE